MATHEQNTETSAIGGGKMKAFTRRAAAVLAGLALLALVPAYHPGEAHAQVTSPIWRAQITIQVGNVSNAGTDDGVRVELSPTNSTWLDYARDDFERNSSFTYDLNLTNIARVSDISRLRIVKEGSDGMCLRSFQLRLNGQAAYTENLNPCRWLDNDSGHVRTYSASATALAAALGAFQQPFPPFRIPRAEIESRIESMVGHFMHGTDLYWGHLHGRGVEASRVNNSTVHVDLDLAYRIPVWFDPEVDVDFDLRFTCNAGRISIASQNVDVDVDTGILADLLTLGLIEFLDSYVSNRIEASWQGVAYTTNLGVNFCPTITVEPNGDVVFTL